MQRRGESGQPVKGQRVARPKAHKAPIAGVSTTELQEQVAALTRELKEAREQQTATSEVLQVISSSSGELAPVFESLLASAKHLCGAEFGIILLREGDGFRTVALHAASAEYTEARWHAPFIQPAADTGLGRVLETKQVVQIADVRAVAGYVDNPVQAPIVHLAGVRSKLSVPMLKEEDLIGVIEIDRQEVRPFTDKQIELVKNFAAQAVIAIENTRLLNELRQRTDDLSESLEQQTGTAEVLRVISSSPGELEPVFKAMLANAVRICQASFGNLFLCEGEVFHLAAMLNAPPQLADYLKQCGRFVPTSGIALDRLLRTKQVVHSLDESAEPVPSASARLAGARTMLLVPMLKEGELVGGIVIYRKEVRPFTEKQIELVQNFAAQAVIAIENTRLLNELRESLQQQTATADVLKVISSSAGELQPVFDTMLAKSAELCEASFGAMWLVDGEGYRTAALHGDLPEAYVEQWRSGTLHLPRAAIPMVRAIRSRKTVHVSDMRKDKAYLEGDPLARSAADIAGVRTLVTVPMLKEGEAIGVITIYRKEVRDFSNKQIELVTNFAAQAVIAIENARLLDELRLHERDEAGIAVDISRFGH
jgi:GAF domain-containing protein